MDLQDVIADRIRDAVRSATIFRPGTVTAIDSSTSPDTFVVTPGRSMVAGDSTIQVGDRVIWCDTDDPFIVIKILDS